MYTVISLFSGIGGIDLAFSQAGFEITAQVEIDPFCQAVLRKHAPRYWAKARIFSNVTKVASKELGTADVMVGGFPCQDVSQAGQRKGIKEDTRSGLWFHFARLIGEVRPRIALLENVPGLLTQDGDRVLADLTALGYDAEWGIMAASGAGAPHRRERWFCVSCPMRQRRGSSGHGQECHCDLPRDIATDQQVGESIQFGISANSAVVGDSASIASDMAGGQSRLSLPRIASASEAVVNATSAGLEGESRSKSAQSEPTRSGGNMGYTTCERETAAELSGQPHGFVSSGDWQAQSILGRAAHGLRSGMDRSRFPARPGEAQHEWEAPRTVTGKVANRSARLKALGNAVVPQVVYPIAVEMRRWLDCN